MKYRASDNGRGRVAGFIYPFYKNVVAQAPGSTNVQLQCHRLADLLGSRLACQCIAQQRRAAQNGFPVVPQQYTGELAEAYRAGCKAGYAEGVQVKVNVRLDGQTGVSEVQNFTDIQKDSLLRSLLKGVVWRVFSTALTVSIILVVFHDTVQIEQALQIGGLEFVLKLGVYFLHERLWVQIGTSIS